MWLENILEFLIRVPILLITLTVHEMAHGWAAYKMGDGTAKYDGRLSLNPLAHIDWLGFALLLVARVGWAKPVMINPRNFRDPKRGMAISALAGPMANLAMAIIGALLIGTLAGFGVSPNGFIGTVLIQFIGINCALMVFNLIPIPPLDGSKVLGAFLPSRLYFQLLSYDRYSMIILLVVIMSGILNPIIGSLTNGLVNGMFALATLVFKLL